MEANEQLSVRRATEVREITSVEDTQYMATDLANFIKQNKLFNNIQGKEFVNVEGWMYAGARLGYFPIVEDVVNLSSDKVYKYQVRVKLLDIRTDKIVGMGVALCSNEESTKKFYAEYAILSMAQTRAIGKAYRNLLAWIIRAAGYMPTPAEEMDDIQEAQVIQEKAKEPAQSSKKQSPAIDTASKEAAQVMPAAAVTAENPLPITVSQKTQILLLLNHSSVTKEKKEKTIAIMNKMSSAEADVAIGKIKAAIKAAAQESGEVASGKQIELVEKLMRSSVFIDDERKELTERIQSGKWLKTEASAAIAWLQEEIELRKSNDKIAA